MSLPEPIENTDPETAALLQNWIEQKLYNKFTITPKGFYDHRQLGVCRFVTVSPDIGRNDPCICGSQKKFKQCCGEEK